MRTESNDMIIKPMVDWNNSVVLFLDVLSSFVSRVRGDKGHRAFRLGVIRARLRVIWKSFEFLRWDPSAVDSAGETYTHEYWKFLHLRREAMYAKEWKFNADGSVTAE